RGLPQSQRRIQRRARESAGSRQPHLRGRPVRGPRPVGRAATAGERVRLQARAPQGHLLAWRLQLENVSGEAHVLPAGAEQDNLGGARALPEPVSSGLRRLRLCVVLGNRSWNSVPILKTEVWSEEEPQEPMEMDDQVETQGQEEVKGGPYSNGGAASTSRALETQGNLSSLDYSPMALKGNVHSRSLTEMNRTDKVQVPAVSFHSKGHGVPSAQSPVGGILTFGKPDPAPAVLPGPVPGCSHWPEKAASQVLGKDHLPSSSGL
ncbi:putative UPF0607 protein ENSP00000382826, partial [Callithrix jacchus]